jgi:hypothetical protein
MRIEQLFPVPLGVFDLAHDFTEDEMSFIKSCAMKKNRGNSHSVETYILESTALSRLKEACHIALNEFYDSVYQPGSDTRLRITQSWINVTEEGQYHHRHFHPNSHLSGTIYVQCDDKDSIVFHNPRDQIMTDVCRLYNTINCETNRYATPTKRILIFPSTLQHSVDEKKTDGLRISISFNSFFDGTIGLRDSLMELTL